MSEKHSPEENEIVIDFKSIPRGTLDAACRVLTSSIQKALADPVKRAEYEAWKKERAKEEQIKKRD